MKMRCEGKSTCYHMDLRACSCSFKISTQACILRYVTLVLYNIVQFLLEDFYYDKSTRTLYKYSHDRLEKTNIRCIHQGIEREKKRKDDSHFVSLNVLILNWKKKFSLYTI